MLRRSALAGVWAVAILAGCVMPQEMPPTVADRMAIVTIEDFAAWIESSGLTLAPEVDTLRRHKIAWSHQLTYEFRGTATTPEGHEHPIIVQSEVVVHPNAPSALHNFNTYWVGLSAGLRTGGASTEKVEPTLEWGDGVDLFLITRDGGPIGNGFIGHSGRLATYVLITGLYSSDPAMFEAAIAPKIAAAESYNPGASVASAPANPSLQ